MALTLDGTTTLPAMGGIGGGSGLAAGAGVIGGLLLGSLINGNGGFGVIAMVGLEQMQQLLP